ncbi:hypothetical protein [Nonlabens sp.]|uniref:hypothetical protein n=1 Tax=Nonlabens sp. TaxID=1888209 RepID=UPI0032632777
MAHNFFNLVRNSIGEMTYQGNKNSITVDYDESLNEEEQDRAFDEQIKWNDNRIGIPILFNYYHGLELFMKGLLQERGISFGTNHNLEELYQWLKTNEEMYTPKLLSAIKNQVYNSDNSIPFFEVNQLKPKDFYIAFKYPVSSNGKTFKYHMIRGKEQESLQVYQKIQVGIDELIRLLVEWNLKRNEN